MGGESTSSMFLCCLRKSRTRRLTRQGCGRDTNGCTGVIKGWSTARYQTFRWRTCTSSRSSSTNEEDVAAGGSGVASKRCQSKISAHPERFLPSYPSRFLLLAGSAPRKDRATDSSKELLRIRLGLYVIRGNVFRVNQP